MVEEINKKYHSTLNENLEYTEEDLKRLAELSEALGPLNPKPVQIPPYDDSPYLQTGRDPRHASGIYRR